MCMTLAHACSDTKHACWVDRRLLQHDLSFPKLEKLEFQFCRFDCEEVLSGVTALQCLTSIVSVGFYERGSCFFDPEFVRLPQLARLVMSQRVPCEELLDLAGPLRFTLPADMGLLSLSLVDLDISGLGLAHFPGRLTQLRALESLDASANGFAELPAGVTALSRLTELTLGRRVSADDPLQQTKTWPLDVVALGDLSGVPALRKLSFRFCEVALCMSLPGGAVQHTSLESICFCNAHLAPECVPMVLQLSQALKQLGRSGVLKVADRGESVSWADDALAGCGESVSWANDALASAQALPPFHKFKAALAWFAL